jgi:hypothetical protein
LPVASEGDAALDALRHVYPYCALGYDARFTTLTALATLRAFCRRHSVIEAFYAKGSIAHGLLVAGSDLDHVRVKVRRSLSRSEKVRLIDALEAAFASVGVTQLRRLREDDYARVFADWNELKDLPNAATRAFELYPALDVLTLPRLDPTTWLEAVLHKAVFIGAPHPLWIQKTGDRIASFFGKGFTFYPSEAPARRFSFAPLPTPKAFVYDVRHEAVNITNYSPFSHVNEVSEAYRLKPFMLPFYAVSPEDLRPVHPDTFADLGLDPQRIHHYVRVFPTSSFRTVFDPRRNVCYKVPLLRRITRGVRDLPEIALRRADYAAEKMALAPCADFTFLPEETHYADDPHFNYITRPMPDRATFPWFSVIAAQRTSLAFQMRCLQNIIKTWMFYAARGLYLEYHTQNILVDADARIYYRDLSDIMIHDGGVSDRPWCRSVSDALALSFDRTVCQQNLDHAFRYNAQLGLPERAILKALIRDEIKKYELPFPPTASLTFSPNDSARVPVPIPLIDWRARPVLQRPAPAEPLRSATAELSS